jgi:hypothetical protein
MEAVSSSEMQQLSTWQGLIMHKTGIYKRLLNVCKVQSVHTTTCSKGSEKEKRYSFTFSLSLVLRASVRGQRKALAALVPGNRPGIHYMGGWVYRQKTRPQRIAPKMPGKAGVWTRVNLSEPGTGLVVGFYTDSNEHRLSGICKPWRYIQNVD